MTEIAIPPFVRNVRAPLAAPTVSDFTETRVCRLFEMRASNVGKTCYVPIVWKRALNPPGNLKSLPDPLVFFDCVGLIWGEWLREHSPDVRGADYVYTTRFTISASDLAKLPTGLVEV